jgi:hypothetical protein
MSSATVTCVSLASPNVRLSRTGIACWWSPQSSCPPAGPTAPAPCPASTGVSLDEEWDSPAWLSTGSSCPDWGFRCAAKIKGFAKFEIVAEFGAGLSLAISDPRGEASARPHLLAQRTDEISVLGEPLDQMIAGYMATYFRNFRPMYICCGKRRKCTIHRTISCTCLYEFRRLGRHRQGSQPAEIFRLTPQDSQCNVAFGVDQVR